jgi:hypothetical protein
MYYSTEHWRPLVNGYTGGQPSEYEFLDLMLQDLFTQPKRAWDALRDSRPTHAIVHEGFYEGRRGAAVSAWLLTNGSRQIGLFGHDRIFELPAPMPKAPR